MTLHLMRSSHAYSGMRDFSIYSNLALSLAGTEVRP